MRFTKSIVITTVLLLFTHTFSYADTATFNTELEKANKSVATLSNETIKTKWYPQYHFAAPAFLISNPNAIIYHNNEYHLYYQQNPFEYNDKKMYMGYAKSDDLLNWKDTKTVLAPSESYDKDSILTGSAIIDNNAVNIIYTGQSENKIKDKTEIHETQNLAISKNNTDFTKSANNPVIRIAPHYSYLDFSSKDFRAPFVWKQSDRYYALVGTQYEKTKDGAVLLFKSKDLRNWVCINITAIGSKGEMGYMWESPNFAHIDGQDVLMITSKGIKPHGNMFLNPTTSGYFKGKLDYNSGKFSQKGAFGLFDYGFDFSSPRVAKTKDGRNIIIGSLDISDTDSPEKADNWSGILSIPREIKIVNDKVIFKPVEELKALRDDPVTMVEQAFTKEKEFNKIKGESYELETEVDLTKANNFSIDLRTNATQKTVLSYDKTNKILKLDRDNSGQNLKGQREAKLSLDQNNILNLHIFVDKSSIEVFANDGHVVMSSRIYPDNNANGIKFNSDGDVILKVLNFYKLKSTKI